MDESLENAYFNWLVSKVVFVENPTPSLTFWNLLREVHRTEFVWLLTGDENRAEDGFELRQEFLLAANLTEGPEQIRLGCSLLEMFIALSRRAEYDTDIPAAEWFWQLMENLGLSRYNDATRLRLDHIHRVLDTLIWRQYEPNGHGGLFPMDNPHHDQTNIEIWYQFSEYLVDHGIQ